MKPVPGGSKWIYSLCRAYSLNDILWTTDYDWRSNGSIEFDIFPNNYPHIILIFNFVFQCESDWVATQSDAVLRHIVRKAIAPTDRPIIDQTVERQRNEGEQSADHAERVRHGESKRPEWKRQKPFASQQIDVLQSVAQPESGAHEISSARRGGQSK